MKVYQAVQFKSLLQLPMKMYKIMQSLLLNFGYSHKFLPCHHHILAKQKKLVQHITHATTVFPSKPVCPINICPSKTARPSNVYSSKPVCLSNDCQSKHVSPINVVCRIHGLL